MKVDSAIDNFEKLYETSLLLYLDTDNAKKDRMTSEFLLDTLKDNIHMFSLIRLLILKSDVKAFLNKNVLVNSYIYDNIKGIYTTMDDEVQRQERRIRDNHKRIWG